MFRDPLSISHRAAKAMTAPAFAARVDVAIGPAGPIRFEDGILEVAGGDLRVAARDIVSIELIPASGGRFQLRLVHRKGFDTIRRRCWVAAADADALHRLAAQVRAALRARAA